MSFLIIIQSQHKLIPRKFHSNKNVVRHLVFLVSQSSAQAAVHEAYWPYIVTGHVTGLIQSLSQIFVRGKINLYVLVPNNIPLRIECERHTKKSRCVWETLQYALGGNKVQKAIFSFKVKIKVTRSLTLVSFERASLVEYACQIWSLHLLQFKSYSEG